MVYHKLSHAIRARYIRFRPTAWYGHISMRVEVYGCKGNAAFSFTIPLIKSAFLQCLYSDLDRNSIICHYFWQHQWAFLCNLISKTTRTCCTSNKLFSIPLDLPNCFINEFDLAANSQYLGKAASFNPMWQGDIRLWIVGIFESINYLKKCARPTVKPVLALKLLCTE